MNWKFALLAIGVSLGAAGCQSTMHAKPMIAHRQSGYMHAAEFVPLVASVNRFQIESSRLALERSDNLEVQRYARQMIAAHTTIGREMNAAVKRSRLPMPSPLLQPGHKKKMNDLASIPPGRDFTKAYLNAQIQAHQDSISLFNYYCYCGTNPPLVRFATATKPKFQTYLTNAQTLRARVGNIQH